MSMLNTITEEIEDYAHRQHWIVCLLVAVFFGYILYRYQCDVLYESFFGGLNFMLHEMGHVITGFCGQTFMIFGGTFVQCLVPLASIIMFYRQGELAGIPFCFGWLATNLFNVATYVGDARAQTLDLVGVGDVVIHDWHFLLAKFNLLSFDHVFAAWLRCAGFVCLWLCVLATVALMVVMIGIRYRKDAT